jgi:hypothetical protein
MPNPEAEALKKKVCEEFVTRVKTVFSLPIYVVPFYKYV